MSEQHPILPLWSSATLAEIFDIKCGDWQASGVSIDSRSLQKGDLFIALAGENYDGHDYVAAAFKAGAVAALVRESYAGDSTASKPLVRVPDVLAALEKLAVAARARSDAYIIAITGSVGKTSSKEMLASALAKSGATHASVQSFNNHIGVPLTLARMPQNAHYGVFELGMNHAGEIAKLVKLVRPHCAIITAIGTAHIENFSDMKAIASAKAEIFSGLIAGGMAIIPADTRHADILQKAAQQAKAKITRFSMQKKNLETYAIKTRLHDDCSCVAANIMGQDVTYKLGVSGSHNVSNSLAVLSAITAAKADLALAALSMGTQTELNGRGRRYQLALAQNTQNPQGAYLLIDESYNANPASMQAALNALALVPRHRKQGGQGGKQGAQTRQGRRIAVLGDMAELGAEARHLHAALADVIAQADIDLVLSCGALMQHLHRRIPPNKAGAHADKPQDILAILRADLRAGDVVMVKGSKAAGMGEIVGGLLAAHRLVGAHEDTTLVENRNAI